MALTLSKRKLLPHGSDRIIRERLTFTSVTGGTWASGAGDLDNIQITNLTAPERAMNVDYTTTPGSLIFTSVTAGDVVDVFTIGTK